MIKLILRLKHIQHLLFWLFSFIILLRLFLDDSQLSLSDLIFSFLFILSILPGVYINLKILIPEYWPTKKWIHYSFFIVLVLCISVLFNEFMFEVLADWIFPGYYFISYFSYWEITQFVAVFIIVSTLLKLSRSWFDLQIANSQLEKLSLSQKTSELKSLKEQINPHFLFNNLNTLYSASLEKSNDVPNIILRLSDLLRFMLYETEHDKIPLKKELQCIRDYFELQKMRISEKANLSCHIEDIPDSIEIAPLLLMPLVENSFKHGISEQEAATFIRLNAYFKAPWFSFKITNSQSINLKERHSGIGLNNLKKRIQILYPGKHKLSIIENSQKFCVRLKVNVS